MISLSWVENKLKDFMPFVGDYYPVRSSLPSLLTQVDAVPDAPLEDDQAAESAESNEVGKALKLVPSEKAHTKCQGSTSLYSL